MVFVNGEVFQEENPSRSIYGPERLLNYPIVVVLINYRVGPLGMNYLLFNVYFNSIWNMQ